MPDPASQPTPLLSRFFAPELRAWHGQQRLSVVFWGHGIVGSSGLVLLHAVALGRDQRLLQQVLIVGSALYTAWILVAIWRCSGNADPFWGTLARWLTVAWAINCTLVLAFLQLDLAIRYAGG